MGRCVRVSLKSRGGDNSYNIIRNNTFQNFWHHNISPDEGCKHIVIEGNLILDAGEDHETNFCGSIKDRGMRRDQHKGLQLESSNCIVRGNVMVNCGLISLTPYASQGTIDNRFYQNTLYANYLGFYNYAEEKIHGNIFKNNIM